MDRSLLSTANSEKATGSWDYAGTTFAPVTKESESRAKQAAVAPLSMNPSASGESAEPRLKALTTSFFRRLSQGQSLAEPRRTDKEKEVVPPPLPAVAYIPPTAQGSAGSATDGAQVAGQRDPSRGMAQVAKSGRAKAVLIDPKTGKWPLP